MGLQWDVFSGSVANVCVENKLHKLSGWFLPPERYVASQDIFESLRTVFHCEHKTMITTVSSIDWVGKKFPCACCRLMKRQSLGTFYWGGLLNFHVVVVVCVSYPARARKGTCVQGEQGDKGRSQLITSSSFLLSAEDAHWRGVDTTRHMVTNYTLLDNKIVFINNGVKVKKTAAKLPFQF